MLVLNTLILGQHEFFKQRKLLSKKLIVKYNVTNTNDPVQLYFLSQGNIIVNGALMFDKIVIDGVEMSVSDLDNAQGTYQFSTAGEHTVKYTLKDPTIIGLLGDGYDSSSIKIYATFKGCSNLESVEIPDSVTTIGIMAFADCSGLTSITIPDNVTNIGESAFSRCGLTSITIPDNVTSIDTEAFLFCNLLTSVTIGNSVTSIGDYAFSSSGSLSSITIPDSVTSIGGEAFSSCISLSSVTIGSGITSISEGAFMGCSNLSSVTVEAATPPILNDFVFDNVSENMKIYVPAESVDAYKSSWSEYSSMIYAILGGSILI